MKFKIQLMYDFHKYDKDIYIYIYIYTRGGPKNKANYFLKWF